MSTSPVEGGLSLPYQTERDPSLDHQVVFLETNNNTFVSCNCLLETRGPHKVQAHAPIGESHDIEKARFLYNNPDNHRKSFFPKDQAKW